MLSHYTTRMRFSLTWITPGFNPFIFSLTQSATHHVSQLLYQSAPSPQSSHPALPQPAGNAGYHQTTTLSFYGLSTTFDTPGNCQHENSTRVE